MVVEKIVSALLVKGAIEVAEFGILNLKKVITKDKRKGFYSVFKKDSKIIIVPSSFKAKSLIYKVEGLKKEFHPNFVTGTQHAISLMLLTQFLSNFSLELLYREDDLHEQERDTNNLILTGSSASNIVTDWFCSKFMGKTASFSKNANSLWFNGKEIFDPHAGMIVFKAHPNRRGKRIILLAGVSQFGTSAAIRFFAASDLLDLLKKEKYKGSWAILVHGDVKGDALLRIHLNEQGMLRI